MIEDKVYRDGINITPQEAETLKGKIMDEFKCMEIYVSDFAPTMGMQAGPGVLGIAFYAEGDSDVA